MTDVYNSHIKVPETLAGAGPYINAVSADVVGDLMRLEAKIAPLADTWRATSATYFEDQRMAWNVAADGLFGPDGVMGMIAHALNVNYQNYTEAELANENTWKH